MFVGNGEYHFTRTKSLHRLSLGHTQYNLRETPNCCTLKCKFSVTKVGWFLSRILKIFFSLILGGGRSSIITGKLGVFSEIRSICSVEQVQIIVRQFRQLRLSIFNNHLKMTHTLSWHASTWCIIGLLFIYRHTCGMYSTVSWLLVTLGTIIIYCMLPRALGNFVIIG